MDPVNISQHQCPDEEAGSSREPHEAACAMVWHLSKPQPTGPNVRRPSQIQNQRKSFPLIEKNSPTPGEVAVKA